MPSPARFILITLAWALVASGWFALTKSQHPTRTLALAVTVTLVLAFAIAAHLNLALRARRRHRGTPSRQVWLALIPAMLLLTALALVIIRLLYSRAGYTPGPIAKHFAIDFFGMGVHVAAAAAIERMLRRLRRPRSHTP